MDIKYQYRQKRLGPLTFNRRGMFGLTSVSLKLPFRRKLIIWKNTR